MKSRSQHKAQLATSVTRRGLLRLGAVAAAAILVPRAALGAEWVRLPEESAPSHLTRTRFIAPQRRSSESARALSIYNVHTGESLNTVYWENGDYVPGAFHEVNYFFRDFRANEVKPIDPGLLDLLHYIHAELETSKPFNLVSGYRSPATNAWLASRTEGVARHSMHVEGKASDINLPGRQLSFLERIALAFRVGGVGYYPRAGFVHVDTGRVRRW
jgi:uncharacterized protein YcbK (DUF882 family)